MIRDTILTFSRFGPEKTDFFRKMAAEGELRDALHHNVSYAVRNVGVNI